MPLTVQDLEDKLLAQEQTIADLRQEVDRLRQETNVMFTSVLHTQENFQKR